MNNLILPKTAGLVQQDSRVFYENTCIFIFLNRLVKSDTIPAHRKYELGEMIMLQSRWFRILKKILLIWLLITVYFYFQHPVTYRFTGLNAVFPIGEDQFVINEISVNNLDREKMEETYKIPWTYIVLEKLNYPLQWNNPLLKVISFYKRYPLSKEYGTIYIYGTYISSKTIGETNMDEMYERLDVYIYPGSGGSGMGSTTANYKNALVVCADGQYPLKDLDKPFLLTVTDKTLKKTTTLLITPQWLKERLKRNPEMKNPADPISEYIDLIYEGKAQKIQAKRLNDQYFNTRPFLANKTITIEQNLKWIDVFEDYYGVYQVDANIYEYAESSKRKIGPPDKITFYTHQNKEGDFEVIYYTLEQIRSK